MRTTMRPLPFLLAVLFVAPAAPGDPADAGADLASRNAAFALDLFRTVGAGGKNVFFAPASLSETLAMVWLGARGETARQMARVLHLPAAESDVAAGFHAFGRRVAAIRSGGKAELDVASALWPQAGEPLRARYVALLRDGFGAVPQPVDYARAPGRAVETINAWVAGRTRDRIRDLLPPDAVDRSTRLVLANAVYFKGTWKVPFEKALTRNAPFQTAPGRTVTAPFLHGSPRAGYLDAGAAQVLELPYEGDDLSLVVLLPRAADGLAALEDSLSAARLSGWLSAAGRARQAVEVILPRFRLESGFTLKGALVSLGMTDAFDPSRADFSGMSSGRPGLFIGEGFHKAFVEVNEEGTEAAAATGVVMVPASVPPPRPVFRADHPFLFLIRDDVTGTILFLGRVADPTR
jgi:serpin B